MQTRFNVQKVSARGTDLYLAHIPGFGMEWTTDAEDAFTFDDIEEAEADAEAFGGEVFTFYRPAFGHSATARLEYHFSQAAE